MHREILMGNEAIALGAIAAGVNLVSGYPGTPSTEVLETAAARRTEDLYVEWSVNEKAALEVAAGASYAGGRALVTMKQVGLNVASDPLMSLEYVGVKGGLVLLVADDPGPISSQTEQDTRTFGAYSKVPVLDPSSVEEAYRMVQEAFVLSERYGTPVILRSTTRISHEYADLDVLDPGEYVRHVPDGFEKDPGRWVIFPGLSYRNHRKIEERNEMLRDVLSDWPFNRIHPATGGRCAGKRAVATHGISYMYVREAMDPGNAPRLIKVSSPYPFPEKLALEFLEGMEEVLCVEELDPVIERELTYIAGKYGLNVRIRGKCTGDVPYNGENSVDSVKAVLARFFGETPAKACGEVPDISDAPPLPARPPVLCAGCPHRASFYAVKQAMKGKKAVFAGDIGCYTLGNGQPLEMADTCLCMGAGFTIPQGIRRIEPDIRAFGFVGDSTFFASGITGVVNAYYNQAELTLCVLDNSTTAMTGHQPHPGTGRTVMGQVVEKVSIENVLRAIGLTVVETVDPFSAEAVETVRRVSEAPGVKAVIFRSPCISLSRPTKTARTDAERCIGCLRCIRELGCPALVKTEDGAVIDGSLCTGCGLCVSLCPAGAISVTETGGDAHV
ncbi:MAG: indolepyruvate ferredoxin oxidoreductase subunit alpha [Lachnospiraceae bacterium]|nr:indolepyruvate ferredoxin oxidoreductase subunit alpha [Lachnospiraceae bacterium]